MIYAQCRIVGCRALQLKLAQCFAQDQPKTLSLTLTRHLMLSFLSFRKGLFTLRLDLAVSSRR